VLIYRATHVINFAQGEMWLAPPIGADHEPRLVVARVRVHARHLFLGGFAIHDRDPALHRAGELTVVMATIALLVILNGLVSGSGSRTRRSLSRSPAAMVRR
jgi:hypothetical protein